MKSGKAILEVMIMTRRKTNSSIWGKISAFFKHRTFVLAIILCGISAVCLAGIYMVEQNKQKDDINLVDLNDTLDENYETDLAKKEIEETESKETATKSVKEENYGEGDEGDTEDVESQDPLDTTDENFGNADEGKLADNSDTAVNSEETEAVISNAAANTGSLNYKETDLLTWPVTGNVILDYSMDKSIYFPTLDQYKYNPALIIQSAVNTQVAAAAKGKISSIEVNEETGTTITMDLGNSYELVYGQVKGPLVEVGDVVNKGDAIAYIAETTKYYSVEGSNLYFQMKKDGKPVDPLELLQ